ncbi:hypothetical protein OPT61_g8871 [Boeremia exigua]|uniref:Uncharacterized protein n=1 Tax=Boeremia exigua TaxID=749465 RepID=A0ACC2HXK4_9PLEO|nr:hypothetical protein OPT61_g8871 [Boeremia exigua]
MNRRPARLLPAYRPSAELCLLSEVTMSTLVNPLIGALHKPCTQEARAEIIQQIWPGTTSSPLTTPKSSGLNWDVYFSFYKRECEAALFDEGKHIAPRTHQDLLNIVRLLRSGLTETEVKQTIRQSLTQQRPMEDENRMLDAYIKLVARLYAMVSIGPMPYEVYLGGATFLSWTHGPLQDAVHEYFNVVPDTLLEPEDEAIGIHLTAYCIDHISGIEVVPTDNLVNHLRLVKRGRQPSFPHQPHRRDIRHPHSPIPRQRPQDKTVAGKRPPMGQRTANVQPLQSRTYLASLGALQILARPTGDFSRSSRRSDAPIESTVAGSEGQQEGRSVAPFVGGDCSDWIDAVFRASSEYRGGYSGVQGVSSDSGLTIESPGIVHKKKQA